VTSPLAGRDDRVREEARQAPRAVTVGEIHQALLVDDVTNVLDRSRDRFDGDLDPVTVMQLNSALLGRGTGQRGDRGSREGHDKRS
jgi:hypothetical protein